MTAATSSQQVSWWSVHEYVIEVLNRRGSWPMVGTPAWCILGNDDPVKVAALFDAAQHWALQVEINQEARADASRAVSAGVDWPAFARKSIQYQSFYAARPWLKRQAS